jgi:hypothetical protein
LFFLVALFFPPLGGGRDFPWGSLSLISFPLGGERLPLGEFGTRSLFPLGGERLPLGGLTHPWGGRLPVGEYDGYAHPLGVEDSPWGVEPPLRWKAPRGGV